jgi:type I restriction enzyme S subunit
MSELPKGWQRAAIGSLCDLKNGMAFKPTDWSDTGLKIVRIQNLNNPNAPFNHYNGEIRDRFIIHSGDLLFAWSGTPGTSFGAHIWRGDKAVLNQHIFRVDFDERCLNKAFFRLAINQKLYELIGKAHGGAGLQHVTKGRFEETLIEVPPLAEQQRIVAKIEELFSELDSREESLTRARAQLGLYRQSLLKAAFQGKLTAYWRAANPDKLEAPEALLSRIRKEREDRYRQALEDWQTALSEWRAKGEVGDRPSKPRRSPTVDTPTGHQRDNMISLPASWQWLQIADIAFVTKLAGFEYTKFVTYHPDGDLPVINPYSPSKSLILLS